MYFITHGKSFWGEHMDAQTETVFDIVKGREVFISSIEITCDFEQ